MTLRTVDRPWIVLQQIKAGSDFDGAVPTDGATPLTPTAGDWTFLYAPGTKGGLYDPTAAVYTFRPSLPVALVGIEILFGGQSTWSISIVDAYANESVLLSGTTETGLVRGSTDGVVLVWGQKLKLVTSGASTAMSAAFKLAPSHLFIG